MLTGESTVLQDTNCDLIYEDPEDEQIDSSYAQVRAPDPDDVNE